MKAALIDNGSLEPAAHRLLRAVASAVSELSGLAVEAVSWRHSDRIPAEALDGAPSRTLGPWLRDAHARGEREFVFVPFLVSARGAIGGSIRAEVAELRRELGFAFRFAAGFDPAAEVLAGIVAERVRETLRAGGLRRPPVVLVDHGGPAPESARLRDAVAQELRLRLGEEADSVAAASMESPEGGEFSFNQPLFEALLRAKGFDRGDVVAAPLFLGPGRHAGPEGDLARIAASAAPGRRVHFTGLIGGHPRAAAALADSLRACLPAVPML